MLIGCNPEYPRKKRNIYCAIMGNVTSPVGGPCLKIAEGSVASAAASLNWMTNLSSFGGPAVRVISSGIAADGSTNAYTGFRR